MTTPLVFKLGGELVEAPADRARIAAACRAVAARRPLVVVHGGGRSVDAEMDRRGLTPRKIDGLRITDAATLDVVVSVLAGSANTALVAALVEAGVAAVGLTGVDAGLGLATRQQAHRTSTGEVADLGFVGDPAEADPRLLAMLLGHAYVPVIASIGFERRATPGTARALLNVNADVMAGRVAAALGATLVIAGATAGVLDAGGATIASLDLAGIDDLIARGTATAGMIAKLTACRTALVHGAPEVRIVDGRAVDAAHGPDEAPGTTLVVRPAQGAPDDRAASAAGRA
ncbi:MAG: acetylglutamate kinase [Vicinamibacterales bacterium]